jgi:UTP--glucose-1-phosphate uridylyltransferase
MPFVLAWGCDILTNQTVGSDFLQHKIPKVAASDLSPVDCPYNPELEWCPPGHGDIYSSLLTSGMLEKLLQAGHEYAFVSNSDNLGAALEPCLLGYFVQNGLSFMMEVADRTKADKKGGHLAQLKSGRLVLREIAQTPESDMTAFQDIQRHKYFNTNNIWLHLPSLKDVLDRGKGILGLPMIRNSKTLDPRDRESIPVYQLETAMGAAISVFDRAGAIRVPRTRFMPVKNTNDLLAIRSDRYILNEKFQLIPNPKRKPNPILIDLDPAYYKFIDRFESRFPSGVPSLLDCESLRVNGDVRFGSDITLKGEVTCCNDNRDTYEMGNRRTIQGMLRI